MCELELEIRPTEVRDRNHAVDAWLVPGHDAVGWLTALLDAGCTTSRLRFRAIGQPGASAIGAVVSGVDGEVPGSWLPYSLLADRIYVPADSTFFPLVDEVELQELLASDSVQEFVWHPTVGLVAFDAQQILQTADLMSLPPQDAADWDQVNPGLKLNDRLIGVLPEQQLTMEMIFESGRGDIGSNGGQISDAPRSPQESSLLDDLFSKSLTPFAKAAKWIADRAPEGAVKPTWINSMGEWAHRMLQSTGFDQSRRVNELKRLMSMLDEDPDAGLRYAIPFGGDAARGMTTGGNDLVSHGVEYGRFRGGGGPASYWDMPYDVRAKLTAKYRELAQRELSLGRYERAAYIYAELLGDYSSAAQILRDGAYFREAAAIYRDKLGQERKAAECLLLGGQWGEAIEIYETLGDWVTVAETYEKLEESEAAKQAWRKACERHVDAGDYLQAAKLQEDHLRDPIAAEELLARGWLEARAGRACLRELFDLFVRTGCHDKSAGWVQSLVCENLSADAIQFDAADLLAELSQQYPRDEVRAAAFDGGRRIVARQLAHSDDRARRRFLPVLRKLRPDDKLLNRDCNRYLQLETSKIRRQRGLVTLISHFELKSDVQWQTVVRSAGTFVAAGYRGESLVLASWIRDDCATMHYDEFAIRSERQGKILLVPSLTSIQIIFVQVVGADFGIAYPVDSARQRQQSESTTPFDSGVVAASSGANGTLWMAALGLNGIDVKGCHQNGSPIAEHTLPVQDSSKISRVLIQSFPNDVIACCIDDMFWLIESASKSRTTECHSDLFVVDTALIADGHPSSHHFRLPDVVTGCSAFIDATADRVAIAFESGGQVHWIQSGHQEAFGSDLIEPVTDFLANEDLLVADQTGSIEIYETREQRLRLKCTYEATAGNVVAALRLRVPDSDSGTEFLLVRSDGRVEIFGYNG